MWAADHSCTGHRSSGEARVRHQNQVWGRVGGAVGRDVSNGSACGGSASGHAHQLDPEEHEAQQTALEAVGSRVPFFCNASDD